MTVDTMDKDQRDLVRLLLAGNLTLSESNNALRSAITEISEWMQANGMTVCAAKYRKLLR